MARTDTLPDRPLPKNAISPCNTWAYANEGAGARTLDLRIKSPLLYQLSYALWGDRMRFDRRLLTRFGVVWRFF